MNVYKSERIIKFITVLLGIILLLDIAYYYLLTYHEELIVRINRFSFLFKISLIATAVLFVRLVYEIVTKNEPVISFEENLIRVNKFLSKSIIQWGDILSLSINKGKLFDQITINIKKRGANSTSNLIISEIFIGDDLINYLDKKGIKVNYKHLIGRRDNFN